MTDVNFTTLICIFLTVSSDKKDSFSANERLFISTCSMLVNYCSFNDHFAYTIFLRKQDFVAQLVRHLIHSQTLDSGSVISYQELA